MSAIKTWHFLYVSPSILHIWRLLLHRTASCTNSLIYSSNPQDLGFSAHPIHAGRNTLSHSSESQGGFHSNHVHFKPMHHLSSLLCCVVFSFDHWTLPTIVLPNRQTTSIFTLRIWGHERRLSPGTWSGSAWSWTASTFKGWTVSQVEIWRIIEWNVILPLTLSCNILGLTFNKCFLESFGLATKPE